MATKNTRRWLAIVTFILSLGAFFGGVFYAVWGDSLTSAPWEFIMTSLPGGGKTLGTVLLVSSVLFLLGLEWTRLWPRVIGCTIVGLTYVSVGVALAYVSIADSEAALNGSFGAWVILGLINLCLAGFMWSERRIEINERKQYDRSTPNST